MMNRLLNRSNPSSRPMRSVGAPVWRRCLSVSAALTVLTVLTACGGPPPAEPVAATAEALAEGEHTWTTADGNRMPYAVRGRGEVTVLLVHCWMCDRSFWSNQVPLLAREYRTIVVDLPGHGKASADRDPWRVETFGEDVAGLMRELELHDVVLVGHSMGGPVALRAAALSPGRVRGIVAVDTLQDAEFQFSGPEVEQYLAAFTSNYAGTCDSMVDQMFPEEGVDAVKEHVRTTACTAERGPVGAALIRDFATIEMSRWFSEAGVPIRAVNASGPNPTKVDTNRKYADYDAVFMDGVGHYPHMTRPDTFNPLLLQAIADILEIDG